MQTATLNKYQARMVDLMSHVNNEEQMAEITDMLSRYFAEKAFAEADKQWDAGLVSEQTIEEWKKEHMRTPYTA